MNRNLIVIISQVPERISKYSKNLRSLSSDFLYFSELTSFLKDKPHKNLRLIVMDNVDGCRTVVDQLKNIRSLVQFETVPILLVCKEKCCENGIEALSSGANDYLSFAAVDKELSIRARMHMNAHESYNTSFEKDIEITSIYPLEDRVTIRKSLWYIHNNISLLKKIEDLSSHVGSSANHINAIFKRHLEKTAFQYVRDIRIKKAKSMLFKTRFPITYIAEELGYSSPANFSTAFKGVVGLTPNEYRKSRISN